MPFFLLIRLSEHGASIPCWDEESVTKTKVVWIQLCGLRISKARRTDRPGPRLALSPTLFLQLVNLPPLLTQLFGQPGVSTPRLSTNRLRLIIKAVECYWTLCRSPHPFQCTAKCENKDCWIMFASIWESESHVSCLKAQKHPNKNVLSTHFTVRSASGWFRNQKPLGSLKTEGICYSFVKLCSLTPSVFWSVVALFISNKWFESLLLWNDCVPTFLLIVFDWAGNQTWNTCEVWLVPAVWNQWHISTTWNKWHSVVQFGHLAWFIMT